jgi:hypothetical protein
MKALLSPSLRIPETIFSYKMYPRMLLPFADIVETNWDVQQIACFEKLFIECVVCAIDTILCYSHYVKLVSAVCW